MNSEKIKIVVALIALGVGVLSIIGLFFIDIPEKNRDLINIALGTVIGWGGSVISFYFGDTDSSRKDGESK